MALQYLLTATGEGDNHLAFSAFRFDDFGEEHAL